MSQHTSRISRRSFIKQAGIALAALSVPALPSLLTRALAATPWQNGMELSVDVEINQPSSGGRYNRPYVAVWLEDSSGKIVRTLALWANTDRGARWLPDLRRWFSATNGTVDATVSSATRNPGKYSLVWDGKNDKKQAVAQGEYYLCIEAAREHGTYQLIRQSYTFGAKAFKATLPGNTEIKAVSLDFH
jgi:hypothetical protein